MKIISYYTIATEYANEVLRLLCSAERHGYSVKTYPVTNLGNWALNCGQKPAMLLRALLDANDDILYLDADATIEGKLDNIMSFNEAIGVCSVTPNKFRSGTLAIRNVPEARAVLHEWVEAQKRNPYELDQIILGEVLNDNGHAWHNLDEKYCHIFDAPEGEKALIKHHQASRRLKGKIR